MISQIQQEDSLRVRSIPRGRKAIDNQGALFAGGEAYAQS